MRAVFSAGAFAQDAPGVSPRRVVVQTLSPGDSGPPPPRRLHDSSLKAGAKVSDGPSKQAVDFVVKQSDFVVRQNQAVFRFSGEHDVRRGGRRHVDLSEECRGCAGIRRHSEKTPARLSATFSSGGARGALDKNGVLRQAVCERAERIQSEKNFKDLCAVTAQTKKMNSLSGASMKQLRNSSIGTASALQCAS